jgi:hypothetical protein
MLTVLVLADVVTAFSTIGSEMFFGWTLPRELQEYTGPQNMAIFSGRAVILLPLWALTVGTRWWPGSDCSTTGGSRADSTSPHDRVVGPAPLLRTVGNDVARIHVQHGRSSH